MKRIPRRPSPRYLAALSRLHEPAHDRAARRHFDALSRTEQAEAIQRLHEQGYTDHGIAHATGYAVEAVRQILGEPA